MRGKVKDSVLLVETSPPSPQVSQELPTDKCWWCETKLWISVLLVDSRNAARFLGDSAGTDATAGHIKGAVNRPHSLNKDENLKLRDSEILRQEFSNLLG